MKINLFGRETEVKVIKQIHWAEPTLDEYADIIVDTYNKFDMLRAAMFNDRLALAYLLDLLDTGDE
jgi:hypothetical protein